MLSFLFRYTAYMMLGISAGGMIAGEFAIVEGLLGVLFAVVIIGGLGKLFGIIFGSYNLKFIDTRMKLYLSYLAMFLVGFLAFFGA